MALDFEQLYQRFLEHADKFEGDPQKSQLINPEQPANRFSTFKDSEGIPTIGTGNALQIKKRGKLVDNPGFIKAYQEAMNVSKGDALKALQQFKSGKRRLTAAEDQKLVQSHIKNIVKDFGEEDFTQLEEPAQLAVLDTRFQAGKFPNMEDALKRGDKAQAAFELLNAKVTKQASKLNTETPTSMAARIRERVRLLGLTPAEAEIASRRLNQSPDSQLDSPAQQLAQEALTPFRTPDITPEQLRDMKADARSFRQVLPKGGTAEASMSASFPTIQAPTLESLPIPDPTAGIVPEQNPVQLRTPDQQIEEFTAPVSLNVPSVQLNQEADPFDAIPDVDPFDAIPSADPFASIPQAPVQVPDITQQVQQQAFEPTPVINTRPPTEAGLPQQDIANIQQAAAPSAADVANVATTGVTSGFTFGVSRPLETFAQAGINTLLPPEVVATLRDPAVEKEFGSADQNVTALGTPGLFALGLVSAAAQSIFPSTRENLMNVVKEVGSGRRALREELVGLDLTAEILGGIPTGRALEKLTRTGISVLSTGNRVQKLTKAINKGRIAIDSGSLSLPRAKQVHAATQAMIREKIARETVPRIIAEGATGAAFGAGVSAFEDIASGESINRERLLKRAGLSGVGGAAFGAATSGLQALGTKLARAPRIGALRFAEEQDILERTARQSHDEVQSLINKGAVKQADAAPLTYAKTMGRLQEAGLELDHDFSFGLGSKFLRNVEKFNLADRALKTKTSDVIMDLIRGTNVKAKIKAEAGNAAFQITKKIQATGMSPQQITRALRYVEVDQAGQPFFNAAARSGRNIRAAWENSSTGREIGQLSQEQLDGLFELRRWFNDDVVTNFPEFAEILGNRKIQGYVPLYQGKNYQRAAKVGGNFGSVTDPNVAKERAASTGFDSRIHEEDINKIIDIYTSQLAKHEAFTSVIPKLARENFKLQMLGRADIAENLLETAARTMNIGMKKELARELGKHFSSNVFHANRDLLNELALRVAPNDPTFLNKVLDTLHASTYANLLFTNVRTLMKQAVQVPLVGAGEVTIPAMVRGQKSWTTKDRVGKVAQELMPLMRAEDPSVLREAILRPDQGFKNIKKFMTAVGKPGEYVFNKLDVRNRGTAFSAAYHQFEEALQAGASLEGRSGQAVLNDLLDGLLSGEKSVVINQWRTHGDEAAKRMYSIIRSRRINFAYGIADTPEFLAEGVGRLIPFTTWSGNMLARVVGDVAEGNRAQLARRVALPLAYLAAFRAATGYDLPGAHPLSAVPGAFGLQVVPSVAGPAIETAKGGPLAGAQEALKFTPVGPLSRVASQVQDAASSRASRRRRGKARLFGLDVDEERDPFQRALPKFLREAVTRPEQALPFDTRRLLDNMLR